MARENPRPSLDDAAALFVKLEPTDADGLRRLLELLEAIGADRSLSLGAQEAIGRAVWALLDLSEGKTADPPAALAEVGEHIEAAIHERADAPTPAPVPQAAVQPATPAADQELLNDFLTESTEHVASAEAALVALEGDPANAEAVNTVFRAFHTIKGTAGYLSLDLVTDLAHAAESLLSRVRDGEIALAGDNADLALRAVDMLEALIAELGATQGAPLTPPEGYDDLVSALAAVAYGHADAAEVAPVRAEAPDRAPKPTAKASPSQAADASIRVRTDRLDRLIDMVGELVIAQSMVAHDADDELARKVEQASKIVRELQDLSLSMRMVPLRATFQRLARAARDVARQCGKEVDFVAEGEDTELDRHMVDAIAEPLVHMIRNAVDHGVEAPDDRARDGKPRVGTVRLRALHAGGSVVVELADDGRGLDRDRILAKGVQRGLVEPGAQLTDAEVFNLIFLPGFSTADQVTDISGRGVGMDVVKDAIEALQAHVDVSSEPGQGTTFTLRLPLTLAITDGMVVRVGAERYIVPTASIRMTFQADETMLSSVVGRGEMVRLRDELLPVVRLSRLFEAEGAVDDPRDGLLVIVDAGDKRCALLVDDLLGQQQVVAKPLGRYLGRLEGVSGSAILGDGRVGIILDAPGLVAFARGETLYRRSDTVVDQPRREVRGGKFLTFVLAGEEYGLEILAVQEIIGLLPITRVPRTPEFVRGVVNLRGKVIPVVDLRAKFGLEPVEATPETCTIVVHAAGVEVGLIVDKVSDVSDLAEVEPVPVFGPDVQTDFLLGIGKREDRITLLLDIDRVLSTQDVVDIHAIALQEAK